MPRAQEYREDARRCTELAAECEDPRLKMTFMEVAQSWTELANEVERREREHDRTLKRTNS